MPEPSYPVSAAVPVVENLHGVEIPDPYRWLENQQAPETRDWIGRQNAFTRQVLDRTGLQPDLERRITELMRIDSLSLPFARGNRYFYSHRRAAQELPLLVMREGKNGEEIVLVDPHPLSEDRSTSVDLVAVSHDGNLLAYGVRVGGEDEVSIQFLNVTTREHLPDQLPRGRYWGLSFLHDDSGFYYTRHDDQGPRVYLHSLGAPADQDRRVFGEGYGPEKIIFAGISDDGQVLLITVYYGSAAEKTEVYFKDLLSEGPIQTLVNDVDARFYVDYADGRFWIETNWDAPNGRLLSASLENPSRENWHTVVPHSEEVIQGFSLVGGRVFLNTLYQVSSRLKIYQPDGSHLGNIPLPALGSVTGMVGRWENTEGFYGFSSFHIPFTIYRFDTETGESQEWARLDVPFDSDQCEVRQEWYTSKDGTRVPIFLLLPRDLPRDGSHPTLLTGYGGFNASMTPGFSARNAVWVERGGVMVLPGLRGGGEFGEEWHRAGMLEKKQNTFDDFIAAAEWLIAEGYTRPEKLAISGRSNGGLLVGAALTQRPDLFRAVVCGYPLLDMVRYHQFLVARFWVPEYGSSEDPEQFKVLHAYSPYHHVRSGVSYPAVLLETGDGDTRVDPLHARKMAALLQASTASDPDHPVLLYYDTRAGHTGGRPLSLQIEDLAVELTFLFWQLGVRC